MGLPLLSKERKNMPITKRGIYHNLKESTYCVGNGEIVLFFSSKMYLTKFLERYKDYREEFAEEMKKNELVLNMDTLSDIILYKQIEKRGFRTMIKGLEISWHELNQYALRKMTDKNISVWLETQKPKLTERLKSTV